MSVSEKMFTTKSKNMVSTNVKEKLPDIKPIEKSEFGSLSYVAGYVISKMYRKSKVSARKDTPEQLELQSLLLSMKSLQDN